jgi:hypothetical protein
VLGDVVHAPALAGSGRCAYGDDKSIGKKVHHAHGEPGEGDDDE